MPVLLPPVVTACCLLLAIRYLGLGLNFAVFSVGACSNEVIFGRARALLGAGLVVDAHRCVLCRCYGNAAEPSGDGGRSDRAPIEIGAVYNVMCTKCGAKGILGLGLILLVWAWILLAWA